MLSSEVVRAQLGRAMFGADGPLAAANLLCHACVDLLDVDGASISLVHDGASQGTFGSSDPTSRRLDEFQFTYGEGPCLDAVRVRKPILVADLAAVTEQRWPAFVEAVLGEGVGAVFALPVVVASAHIGALDLYNRSTGGLTSAALAGALYAAELAAVPLLDLMNATVDWDKTHAGESWDHLESLERVEVYQATGMIMAQLDVDPAQALARLRAHAYAHAMTASEVAWAVVQRRLVLEVDQMPEVGS